MAPPGDCTDTDTNATSTDTRQNPWGGVDSSGGTGPAHGEGGRPIRDKVRAATGVAQVRNKGEGPRHTTVGVTGKFEKNVVMRGAPLSSAEMDNKCASDKRGRGVQRDRVSGIYLENLCLHHEQPATLLYHSAQLSAQFQTGERDEDRKLGGESGSAACRAVP